MTIEQQKRQDTQNALVIAKASERFQTGQYFLTGIQFHLAQAEILRQRIQELQAEMRGEATA